MANLPDNSSGALAAQRPSIFTAPGVSTDSCAVAADGAVGSGIFAATPMSRPVAATSRRPTRRLGRFALTARLIGGSWFAAVALLVALCVALAIPRGNG